MNEVIEKAEVRRSLEEIKTTLKGLSIEIEGGRQHHSSSSDFLQIILRDLLEAVKSLEKKL